MPIDPFAPAQLGPITIRNRFIKAATFEGMSEKNKVTDRIIDYHMAVVDGGVGMTTLAYCAVSEDGQGAPNEIIVTSDALDGLTEFAARVHATGASASIQIGHAGPVGITSGGGWAPSRIFAPQGLRFTKAADEATIRRIIDEFGDAAEVAVDAGFDAIELHFGHGYFPSSFMSPCMNRRTDGWGGTLEKRARVAREIAQLVRDRVTDRIAVIAKLNMADGVDGGLWLDESVQIARLLEADGTLDALMLTGGSSFENPMYTFRGAAPIAEIAEVFPQPMKTGFKLFGKRFLPEYPFDEAYFLPYARQFRDALSMPLILLGGINRFDTAQQALDEGFAFVAMARALLREPDLLNHWKAGDHHEGICIHCNKCMPSIYEGTHCVLVAPSIRPGHRASSDNARAT
ncbi:MAG: NADH:flavin oxidoreductase [Acidimicrobiales bacterium]|nr:NADH:flavin oxidoreductase [Acidimicrobiales bacterium]